MTTGWGSVSGPRLEPVLDMGRHWHATLPPVVGGNTPMRCGTHGRARGLGLMTALSLLVSLEFAASGTAAAVVPRVPVFDAGVQASLLQVRPSVITYTGDDTGFFAGRGTARRRLPFGRLRWRAWNRRKALGAGSDWINDCVPFCAKGVHHPFPIQLTLYRPRREYGYLIFTRLRAVYTRAIPPGLHLRSYVLRVAASHRSLFWAGPPIA
jgi:hypothetical protein